MSLIEVVTPGQYPLKVLVYGIAKSGKTRFALSFPRPAIIDSEGGSALFVGRLPGLESLPTLTTTELDKAEQALTEFKAGAGKTFDTLIIDSISKFYDVLTWWSRQGNNGNLDRISTDGWDRIHSRLRHFTDLLTGLKMHVVVTAHEVPVWESQTINGRLVQTQTKERKIKADPLIKHWADVIVQMGADQTATIRAIRGVDLKSNGPFTTPCASPNFEWLMRAYTKSAPVPAKSAQQSFMKGGDSHDGQ